MMTPAATSANMPPMGRRRNTKDHGLEPRVYAKHGAFYYVHRSTGKWESLGKDKAAANARARIFNDPHDAFGTLVYWLDMWIINCTARVAARTMAARTLADYAGAVGTDDKPGALRAFFAPPLTPLDLTPEMVQDYLDTNAELGRPVPGTREKAALSSCMGWLIRTGKVAGLKVNPCLRASGIQRNAEKKRDRYVTHDEYRAVWAQAHTSVRLMMELTYRTLQRPESDIIHWTTGIVHTAGAGRELRFKQGKTGRQMRVQLSDELHTLMRGAIGEVPTLHQPIVHTRKGQAYTYDGLSAMLKRAIGKAKVVSFGFRDLKGKGATDMWRAGVPIEQIQQLCGHEDKTTTEIYVKQRWHETAAANQVVMG
jgi:integrase